MNHDWRCPRWFAEDEQMTCPACDLIASVRQDERVAALQDAVDAVQAVVEPWPVGVPGTIPKSWAVAAIEALGGER